MNEEERAKELSKRVKSAFSDPIRMRLLPLWQDLAENMYPERAYFTSGNQCLADFSRHLNDSMPVKNRFDLQLATGEMLRPRSKQWFKQVSPDTPNNETYQEFLDQDSDRFYNTLYRRKYRYQEAEDKSDGDILTFGCSVTSCLPNKNRDGVVFRNHHLVDCSWADDPDGQVDTVYRKDRMTLRQVRRMFPDAKLTQKREDALKKSPESEIDIYHVCMPTDDQELFDPVLKLKNKSKVIASIYIDIDENIILREGGYDYFPYVIKRWQRYGNSQYALSPIALYSLPDARVAQINSLNLLDTAEKHITPPIIVKQNALVDGQVNNYAGGVTYVDDQVGNGRAVETYGNEGNLNIGIELKQDMREVLASIWYISKIGMPNQGDMTAAEVYERIEERMRTIAPLIEPFEAGNIDTLDLFAQVGDEVGIFPDYEEIPEGLDESRIEWEFDGPVQQAREKIKVSQAQESYAIIQGGAQLMGESAGQLLSVFDLIQITKDAVKGVGAPGSWFTSQEELEQAHQQQQQEQEQAQQQQVAQQALMEAEQAGKAAQGVPAMSEAAPILEGLAQQMGVDQQQPVPENEGLGDFEDVA